MENSRVGLFCDSKVLVLGVNVVFAWIMSRELLMK